MSLEVIRNEDGSETVDFPEIDMEFIMKNPKKTVVSDTKMPVYVNYDWIPVGIQPKKNGWYLVYAETYGKFGPNPNHEGVMFSRWNGKNWTANRHHCITHWMHIPTKPYVYLEDIKR